MCALCTKMILETIAQFISNFSSVFPFISSLFFFLSRLPRTAVCVCVHYTYVLDRRTQANRRARIAINKIPLCNYVVTISTRMGRLFPEPLLCIK